MIAIHSTAPKDLFYDRKDTCMKHWMKTFALLGMSACLLTGSAISACARTPGTGTDAAGFTVVSHKTSDCGSRHTDAALVAQFRDAEGKVREYTICAEGGEVNGKKGVLHKVDAVFPVYAGDAYTGTLDNGEQVLTLVCYNDDESAIRTRDTIAYVDLSALEGYEAYLVGADGTETKIEMKQVDHDGRFHIDLRDGAALIHLVPVTAQ